MARINPYLTFNGNCREAMLFYQKCLGGRLSFQTIGESPQSGQMPPNMKNCILHATLAAEGFVLMGSDMASEEGLVKGNAVSLLLNFTREKEIKTVFRALSANGIVKHPLAASFRGALFGDLTDRFGHHWILNCNKK